MTNANVNLSAPWVTFFHELEELFRYDSDVKVIQASEYHIKVCVAGEDKAEALMDLLPEKKTFGNIVVAVEVCPENKTARQVDLFRRAFEGNGAVSYIKTVENEYHPAVDYVVFRNQVVQFFNDNISDINGNESTLYEDIAKEVFEKAGVFFCTDTEGKVIG